MKITRKQLRQIIKENVALVNEGNKKNVGETNSEIKHEDVKNFPHEKLSTGRFIVVSKPELTKLGGGKVALTKLAKKYNFKNYKTTVHFKEGKYFGVVIFELKPKKSAPPPKGSEKKIIGQDLEYIGPKIKKLGKKMSDYVYYNLSTGYVVAFLKDSQDLKAWVKRLPNAKEAEFSQEELQSAYNYKMPGLHEVTRKQLRQLIKEVISDDQDFLHYETDAVYAELVDLLDDIAAPSWIRQNLEDGLTKDQIIAKARRGEVRSREWMSTDSDGDDYPKTVGYTDPKGEKQMIVVNSLDDMNDILDLLADRDIPYSVD